MTIAFAADHAGFELKNRLRDYLQGKELEVLDLGAFSAEASDYPDFARTLGEAVRAGQAERGILICGSGVGACVAANKVKGIRAGLCHDSYSARQGVEHDDINVLVLGSRVVGEALARDLVDHFLAARFTAEERHQRRLGKVQAIEREECGG